MGLVNKPNLNSDKLSVKLQTDYLKNRLRIPPGPEVEDGEM